MAADPDVPHNAYSKLDCQTNAQDYGRAKAGYARFSGLSKEAGHGEDCISQRTQPTVTKRKRPSRFLSTAFIYAGNDLRSHTLSRAVPSAQRGLTSVFGMGTGGSPAVRSPTSRSSELRAMSFEQSPQTFKDREDETSQLNRLGVAYSHLCLLPISTTVHRLWSARQLSVLHLSHSVSNDFNNIANSSSVSNRQLATEY